MNQHSNISRTYFLHLPTRFFSYLPVCFDFAPSDQFVNCESCTCTYTHEIFLFFRSDSFRSELLLLPCWFVPYFILFSLRSDIMCASVAAGAHPFTKIKRTEWFRISSVWWLIPLRFIYCVHDRSLDSLILTLSHSLLFIHLLFTRRIFKSHWPYWSLLYCFFYVRLFVFIPSMERTNRAPYTYWYE